MSDLTIADLSLFGGDLFDDDENFLSDLNNNQSSGIVGGEYKKGERPPISTSIICGRNPGAITTAITCTCYPQPFPIKAEEPVPTPPVMPE